MEQIAVEVSLPPTGLESLEGLMLKEDVVREVLSRIERGEKVKAIAPELGVDRKTIKRWRRIGGWRAQKRKRSRTMDAFSDFIRRRGPEVGWNAVVLYRELCGLGFSGNYQQVQRYVQPLRCQSRWAELAAIRFETDPGEQAQIDFGQLTLWIGDKPERAHLFAFTLGYSRRIFTQAFYHERLSSLIDGPEQASGISEEYRSVVFTTTRARSCSDEVTARCYGIHCSRTLPATGGLRPKLVSRAGHRPKARSKAGSSTSSATP
jgi:hypothetical protein